MFKAVILDLDGTLAYTIDDLRTGMNLMLNDMGYPLRSVEQIFEAINCGSREFVRRSLPEEAQNDEAIFEKCFALYNKHYSEHYLDSTYAFDGSKEMLYKLKNSGLSLAVLSNKGDEHTKNMIARIFPEGLFDIVLGNTGRFPTKPCPDSALYIASKLGANPEEVLYVGDSNVDMETACNAGFYPCGVLWGYRDASVLIASGAATLIAKPAELALVAGF